MYFVIDSLLSIYLSYVMNYSSVRKSIYIRDEYTLFYSSRQNSLFYRYSETKLQPHVRYIQRKKCFISAIDLIV